MNLELEGTSLLLQQALTNLKYSVNENNVEWITARMINGKTAVAQLIESKCASLIPDVEDPDFCADDHDFYFGCQAALYSIQSRAERYLGFDCMPFPDGFLHYLLYYTDEEIEDDLLLACWTDFSHQSGWFNYTEDYIDISDGAKARQRKWLMCPPQQIAARHASETVATGTYTRIERLFERLTKYLYLHVTLDEWVTAYNADSGQQNDPEEIKNRVREILME